MKPNIFWKFWIPNQEILSSWNKKKNRQKVPKKVLKKFRKKVLKIDEEYYAELFEKNWLQKSQKNDQKQRKQTEYKIRKTLVRREIFYEKHPSAKQQ